MSPEPRSMIVAMVWPWAAPPSSVRRISMSSVPCSMSRSVRVLFAIAEEHFTLYERLVEARLGYNHNMKHVEMRTLVTKQHILEGAGYIYNFYREVYFNREAKSVF